MEAGKKKKKQLKMWLNISGIMICFSFMKRTILWSSGAVTRNVLVGIV